VIDLSRIDRYLFRGYAVGFGGLIWEPSGVDFPAEATVCLPLTGGRDENETSGPIFISEPGVAVDRSRFEISFSGARSTANGQYLANRTRTQTTVTTEIQSVRIVSTGYADEEHGPAAPAASLPPGVHTRHTVEIESLRLVMESEHNLRRGEQTRIRVVNHDLINTLRIDGQEIRIEYATGIMNKLTYDDLKNAYEHDANFHAKHEGLFKEPPGHSPGSFPASDGVVLCTIVSGVTGLPADVTEGNNPNEILIPDFGLIALGEMFIYTHERRLTLVRLALGCPTKGDTTLGEIGTDGNNWPP